MPHENTGRSEPAAITNQAPPDADGAAMAVPIEPPSNARKKLGRTPGPFGWVLDLFSSVWLGVTLLVLLFIYSSIGSAGMPVKLNIFSPSAWMSVREIFELSEFQWFHWWPFDLMIALICINLVVATIRRIPFNVVNLGVWMIHSGIIILALGSVWYFSTKMEGDAYIARRAVVASIEGDGAGAEPIRFSAVPGMTATVGSGANAYQLQVQSITPNWELLSGDDAGDRTYKVSVMVQGPDGMFIRELLAGYPEYTEDLVRSDDPQQPFARAKNVRGTRIVDEKLNLALDYQPQEWFYLRESRAIYLREVGAEEWIERPIRHMPLFNDYIADASNVWMPSGETMPVDPINVEVPPTSPDDPLPEVTFSINEYLRYAVMRTQRVAGSERLNPSARVLIQRNNGQQEDLTLVAFDPSRSSALGGAMEFRWAESEEAFRSLTDVRPARLHIVVPDGDVDRREPITDVAGDNEFAPFIAVEGTPYAYRIRAVQDRLRTNAGMFSLAIVEITNGEQTWTRWVSDDPSMSRDLPMEDGDGAGHAQGMGTPGELVDEGIVMSYEPAQQSALRLVAGPEENRLRLVIPRVDPQAGVTNLEVFPIQPGQPIALNENLAFTVRSYLPRSRDEMRPAVVPERMRQRDVGMQASMARVNIPGAVSSEPLWLEYHHYPFERREEVLRRFRLEPTLVRMNDGRLIEVLFSRRRAPLPEPVALETFRIRSNVGGFTGTTDSIRDYKSFVTFRSDEGWTEPAVVNMNNPREHAGLWYFQAQWDPPDPPRFQGDPGSQGLNYTVLGVANRNGVLIQLWGCIIAVIGMIYAFYVKPYIKRRRQQAVYATVGAGEKAALEQSPAAQAGAAPVDANGASAETDGEQSPESDPFTAPADPSEKETPSVHSASNTIHRLVPFLLISLAALTVLAVARVATAQPAGAGDTMVPPDSPPVSEPMPPSGNQPMMNQPSANQPMAPSPNDAVTRTGTPVTAFEEAVDLTGLESLAVHNQGRVRSFESFATSYLDMVKGRAFGEHSATFLYLDMMLRPQTYEDADVIYVKNKLVRAQIAETLGRSLQEQLSIERNRGSITDANAQMLAADFNERMNAFLDDGMIAPVLLQDQDVNALLMRLEQDVMRTAKVVNAIRTAQQLRNPQVLSQNLRLLPPPGGGFDDGWHTLDELAQMGVSHPSFADMPSDLRQGIQTAWRDFTEGWRFQDADAVNNAAARLVELLPQVNDDPEVYPALSKLSWESWYFRAKNLTWVWLIYAFALVPLLLFAVFRWPAARWAGLALFLIAFGFHTFAVLLRWYVSGRWPNSNMFEAVTTAAWFGGCFAVLFELVGWRTPVRGLLALGSAAASMVALMCAHFMPLSLNPSIGNMMPVLHDVWLYIHTNVIIFSYCLIFMAAVSAGLYLALRGWHWLMTGQSGEMQYARVGGAGSLIMTSPDGSSYLARAKTTVGQVLDGTTMILMELSFVLLWAGIVMGAIWADHSWGRPWGWDPKEVFALNTFIVFAVLIHTRLKVKDKGLWTAVLAVIGCIVMLFNWIIINFTIAGLHSYA